MRSLDSAGSHLMNLRRIALAAFVAEEKVMHWLLPKQWIYDPGPKGHHPSAQPVGLGIRVHKTHAA